MLVIWGDGGFVVETCVFFLPEVFCFVSRVFDLLESKHKQFVFCLTPFLSWPDTVDGRNPAPPGMSKTL